MSNIYLLIGIAVVVVLIYFMVNYNKRDCEPSLRYGVFNTKTKCMYDNKPEQGPGSNTGNVEVPPSPGVMQGVIRRIESNCV